MQAPAKQGSTSAAKTVCYQETIMRVVVTKKRH